MRLAKAPMINRPPFLDERAIMIQPPHPATLELAAFLKQCEINTGRAGGPGGQHRNKVETAIRIRHTPTDVDTHATERRSQGQNRHIAVFRLRLKLACKVRCYTPREGYKPSALWCKRRQGEKMSVNAEHEDYPALLSEALDVIVTRRYDVAGSAGVLGITMSQLTRLVRSERHAFARINECREEIGLPHLRS